MATSFAKHVDMNGLGVYGEKGVSDEKMLYVAAIFAELLDNDENGIWDDSHVFGLAPGASRLTEAMDAARGGHRGILDEPQTCQGIANEWEL
jgi:hypothetical protein